MAYNVPKEHGISGSCKAFSWTFNRTHTMFLNTMGIMHRPLHPMRDLLEKRWNEADKTGLWIYVYSSTKVNRKAFIRAHHSRRIRFAIFDALKEIGLDKEGRQPLATGSEGLMSDIKPIVGSLSIYPKELVLMADYQDLVIAGRQLLSKIQNSSSKPRRQWAHN
jgi:hypothetical protein